MRKPAIALAALGLLSAVTTIAPQPALAHDWGHRGWGHEHHGGGAAIGLGILGGVLAGAAIASSQAYYAPPAYYYPAPSAYYSPYYYGYAGYGYYR